MENDCGDVRTADSDVHAFTHRHHVGGIKRHLLDAKPVLNRKHKTYTIKTPNY
jgi:hypothetical protein